MTFHHVLPEKILRPRVVFFFFLKKKRVHGSVEISRYSIKADMLIGAIFWS